MKTARIALIGLVLLMAAVPSPALAKKGHGSTGKREVSAVGIDDFTVSCRPGSNVVTFSLTLSNKGDGDRTFSVLVRISTGASVNHAGNPHTIDFGNVTLKLGDPPKTFDTKPIVLDSPPGAVSGQLFIHLSNKVPTDETPVATDAHRCSA